MFFKSRTMPQESIKYLIIKQAKLGCNRLLEDVLRNEGLVCIIIERLGIR